MKSEDEPLQKSQTAEDTEEVKSGAFSPSGLNPGRYTAS